VDNSKGRYWDRPWSLVDGCTPCSPGCDHCWSMAMGKRFHRWPEKVTPHPDRLDIPLRTRKPTVFAVWNDLFHEDVPFDFQNQALINMALARQHTFLILTKRPHIMAKAIVGWRGEYDHVYLGLTICNQDEADSKIPEFLAVPGKKFLSIEPMFRKNGDIVWGVIILNTGYRVPLVEEVYQVTTA